MCGCRFVYHPKNFRTLAFIAVIYTIKGSFVYLFLTCIFVSFNSEIETTVIQSNHVEIHPWQRTAAVG